MAQADASTPEATPVWANSVEALGALTLPADWVADIDLTGSVTVTHPAEWAASEQGMYELSFLAPRHAWAKVRVVDRASSIGGSIEKLAALAEQLRALESKHYNVIQVEQTMLQEPVHVALVSLYARDRQRSDLLCQVVHAWLPLEDDHHVYGTLGRYGHVAPSLTVDEVDTLLRMMIASARTSLPASP